MPVLAYCSSVRICSVSDTQRRQSSPAAVPIYPARPVWYRVQTGAACPASGRVCRCVVCCGRSALHLARPVLLPVVCSPSGCAGGWGLHRQGIQAAPGVGWSTPRVEKIQKRRFSFLPTLSFLRKTLHPPPLSISKIPRKNKKTPTKGLCSVLYLPYKP